MMLVMLGVGVSGVSLFSWNFEIIGDSRGGTQKRRLNLRRIYYDNVVMLCSLQAVRRTQPKEAGVGLGLAGVVVAVSAISDLLDKTTEYTVTAEAVVKSTAVSLTLVAVTPAGRRKV